MVDIHTHLLFGVDDGPKTLDESIEMIIAGKKIGFTKFFLTSHYGKDNYLNNNYEKNFIILSNKLKEMKIDVEIHKGNEVYLNEGIDRVLMNKSYNTVCKNFLLVEFSPLTLPDIGVIMLKKIIKNGYIPILAHVERYYNFKEKDLKNIRDFGVKLQVNISGKKPKHIKKLLKKGYIDFLASDAHNLKNKSYMIENDLEFLKKLVGEKNLKRMTTMSFDREGIVSEGKKNCTNFFLNIFRNIFTRD